MAALYFIIYRCLSLMKMGDFQTILFLGLVFFFFIDQSLQDPYLESGFLEAMAAVKEAEGAVASYEVNLKASNMKPFGGRGCWGGAGDEKRNVG